MEEWKPIPDYESFYEASSEGRIRNLKSGKILKQTKTKRYLVVGLYVNGVLKIKLSHILIADSFYGKSNLDTDHINNIKTDNRVLNLQRITRRLNSSKDRKRKYSKYTGVCFSKRDNRWQSGIQINGKTKHLGLFKCEFPAHLAYQKALLTINRNSISL